MPENMGYRMASYAYGNDTCQKRNKALENKSQACSLYS